MEFIKINKIEILKNSIENLENEIIVIRNEFNRHTIWLFILAISIDSLNSSIYLKVFAYFIGILIFFYNIQIAIGTKGDFTTRYNKLKESIDTSNENYEFMKCLVENNQNKMKKIKLYDFVTFILPFLFYMFSIVHFFYVIQK